MRTANIQMTQHVRRALSVKNLLTHVFLCVQARNKQNGELAAIKVIKMEPGETLNRIIIWFLNGKLLNCLVFIGVTSKQPHPPTHHPQKHLNEQCSDSPHLPMIVLCTYCLCLYLCCCVSLCLIPQRMIFPSSSRKLSL